MAEGSVPGLRQVLIVAAAVFVAVFGLELLTLGFPPLQRLFGDFPITIAVLVVGTIGVLGLIVRRPQA